MKKTKLIASAVAGGVIVLCAAWAVWSIKTITHAVGESLKDWSDEEDDEADDNENLA